MSLQEVIYPYGSDKHLNAGIITAATYEVAGGGAFVMPDVQCTTIEVAGASTLHALAATTVAASGAVTCATTLGVTGASSLAAVSASGALSAASISTAGALLAASISTAGALSAGAVSCSSVASSGAITSSAGVNGATLAITGAATAGSMSTTGTLNVSGASTLNSLSVSGSSVLTGVVNTGNVQSTSATLTQLNVGTELASLYQPCSQNPAASEVITNISQSNAAITGGSDHLRFIRVYDEVMVNFQFEMTASASASSVGVWELPADMIIANFVNTYDAVGLAHATIGGADVVAQVTAVAGTRRVTFSLPVVNTTVYQMNLQFSARVGRV